VSFLQEVSELNTSSPTTGCKVKAFIESQDIKKLAKTGQEPLTNEELLEARKYNTLKAIHRALLNRGYKWSIHTVANHLKGDCLCARKES
jgi:hypothetical protein